MSQSPGPRTPGSQTPGLRPAPLLAAQRPPRSYVALLIMGGRSSFDQRRTPFGSIEVLREVLRRARNAAITQLVHPDPPPGCPVRIASSHRGAAYVSAPLNTDEREQRSHHPHLIDAVGTRRGRIKKRVSWIIRDQFTQVMETADHLARLGPLNHDILSEDLVKMLNVALIDVRHQALDQSSVVDGHLDDETLPGCSTYLIAGSLAIPRSRCSS